MSYCKCGNPLAQGHRSATCLVCLLDDIRTRLKNGHTQSQVARDLGYSRQYISIVLLRDRIKRELERDDVLIDKIEYCPHCGSDLTGPEIPEELRAEYYGGQTHYSRKIGIYDQNLDYTIAWECPDCGKRWSRFERKEWEWN